LGQIGGDRFHAVLVVLLDGQFQQFLGVEQPLMQAGEIVDDAFELAAFLAQCLGQFRVVPDFRVL